MKTRKIVALGVTLAVSMMSMPPTHAADGQGPGSITGIAKDSRKPHPDYSVRGRITEGAGAGNLTQPVQLDTNARFNLTGMDPAKYVIELLNKDGKVICTEGPFDLTQQANRQNVVIDCANPAGWWLLAAAAAAGVTAGVVAADDEPATPTAGGPLGKRAKQ